MLDSIQNKILRIMIHVSASSDVMDILLLMLIDYVGC